MKKPILVVIFLLLILLPYVQSNNDKGSTKDIEIVVPTSLKYGDNFTITVRIPKDLWEKEGLAKIRVILRRDNNPLFRKEYENLIPILSSIYKELAEIKNQDIKKEVQTFG